jgi:signal transduction histidine kinase
VAEGRASRLGAVAVDPVEDGLGTLAMARLLGVSFLLRMSALALALFSLLAGGKPTVPFIVGIVVLTGVSFVGISQEARVVRLLTRHPILVTLDVLLGMTLVAAVGIQSPLVLATLSTAFIVGLLYPLRVGGLIIATMVGGYVIVAGSEQHQSGFISVTVIPLLYVSLYAVGDAFRRVTDEQVRSMRALVAAQNASSTANERARLAREMHDSLAKTLHGIAIGATALPTWVRRDPDRAVVEAEQLATGAERAAGEARAILVRMRADQPDRPLVEILGKLCADWSATQAIPCRFQAVGVADLDHDVRYELTAIAVECLENVARHADASSVEVELRRTASSVRLSLQDNGVGFDSDRVADGHFGLIGIQERAAQVGGVVRIRSHPGDGTHVVVELEQSGAPA